MATRVCVFDSRAFQGRRGKTIIPDGAIVYQRGKKRWTDLVEVKTATAALKDDRVGAYLDIAREHGFDGVFAISH